ncbi:MAG: hypothetical protein K2J90_04200 [Lachnospiraceae bacterium]|nr:hypothetical protein [Lachnospiraceae bacterium]
MAALKYKPHINLTLNFKPSLWRQIKPPLFLCIIINLLYRRFKMLPNISKFTLRTDLELLKKFHLTAKDNARSANREIEVLMRKHVAEFEKEHGKIEFD